ncbi:MAG: DDE-type integrase/transposase/recombinase [Caldisericia bacterium]|nr:DDE-type integrase/transposase/recombinase [Caldisericia bacterium]
MPRNRRFYRIIREQKLQNHRVRTQPGGIKTVTSHEAKDPDGVWSWDISWIPGPIAGLYYYLYLILDIFSHKIVGWEIWEKESEHFTVDLIRRAVLSEKIGHRPLVLHSDNESYDKRIYLSGAVPEARNHIEPEQASSQQR